MANTAEMRRLMLHAADLLDAQDNAVRHAFRSQLDHARCEGSDYAAYQALGHLGSFTAASSLAQAVLRMVAAAVADEEVPDAG